MNADRH